MTAQIKQARQSYTLRDRVWLAIEAEEGSFGRAWTAFMTTNLVISLLVLALQTARA